MKISDATNVLRSHNDWRQGVDIPPVDSTDLTRSIDAVLDELERLTEQVKSLSS